MDKLLINKTKKLLTFGEPSLIRLSSAIVAPEGINYIDANFDRTYTVWIGTIDHKLNENTYLASGVGGVRDFKFGSKP